MIIWTVQVREHCTDWDLATIGKVEQVKKTYFLRNLQNKLIAKSTSIEHIAAAGRALAAEQGYRDAAYAAAV